MPNSRVGKARGSATTLRSGLKELVGSQAPRSLSGVQTSDRCGPFRSMFDISRAAAPEASFAVPGADPWPRPAPVSSPWSEAPRSRTTAKNNAM